MELLLLLLEVELLELLLEVELLIELLLLDVELLELLKLELLLSSSTVYTVPIIWSSVGSRISFLTMVWQPANESEGPPEDAPWDGLHASSFE